MLPQTIRKVLNVLFTVLWVADLLLTVQFVGVHGLRAEANPIMRWALGTCGVAGFATLKMVALYFWLCVEKYGPLILNVLLTLIMVPVVYLGVLTVGA